MEKKFIDYAEQILAVRKKLGQLASEAEIEMWGTRCPEHMEDEVLSVFKYAIKELDEIIAKYL